MGDRNIVRDVSIVAFPQILLDTCGLPFYLWLSFAAAAFLISILFVDAMIGPR